MKDWIKFDIDLTQKRLNIAEIASNAKELPDDVRAKNEKLGQELREQLRGLGEERDAMMGLAVCKEEQNQCKEPNKSELPKQEKPVLECTPESAKQDFGERLSKGLIES